MDHWDGRIRGAVHEQKRESAPRIEGTEPRLKHGTQTAGLAPRPCALIVNSATLISEAVGPGGQTRKLSYHAKNNLDASRG